MEVHTLEYRLPTSMSSFSDFNYLRVSSKPVREVDNFVVYRVFSVLWGGMYSTH